MTLCAVCCYSGWHYVEFHYADCQNVKYFYVVFHCDECQYTNCCYAGLQWCTLLVYCVIMLSVDILVCILVSVIMMIIKMLNIFMLGL
jgi:hypothetical protein